MRIIGVTDAKGLGGGGGVRRGGLARIFCFIEIKMPDLEHKIR